MTGIGGPPSSSGTRTDASRASFHEAIYRVQQTRSCPFHSKTPEHVVSGRFWPHSQCVGTEGSDGENGVLWCETAEKIYSDLWFIIGSACIPSFWVMCVSIFRLCDYWFQDGKCYFRKGFDSRMYSSRKTFDEGTVIVATVSGICRRYLKKAHDHGVEDMKGRRDAVAERVKCPWCWKASCKIYATDPRRDHDRKPALFVDRDQPTPDCIIPDCAFCKVCVNSCAALFGCMYQILCCALFWMS